MTPIALAVLRLITSSKRAACSIGTSRGAAAGIHEIPECEHRWEPMLQRELPDARAFRACVGVGIDDNPSGRSAATTSSPRATLLGM